MPCDSNEGEHELLWMMRMANVKTFEDAKCIHTHLAQCGQDDQSIRDMVVWTLYRMCDINEHSYGEWAKFYQTTRNSLENEYVRRIQ